MTVAGLQAHSEDSPQGNFFSFGTQLLNRHLPPLREIHFCPCPCLASVMVLGFTCRGFPLWTFEFLLIILMLYLLLRLLFRLILTPLASLPCVYILLVSPFPLSCHPSWLCAPMFPPRFLVFVFLDPDLPLFYIFMSFKDLNFNIVFEFVICLLSPAFGSSSCLPSICFMTGPVPACLPVSPLQNASMIL